MLHNRTSNAKINLLILICNLIGNTISNINMIMIKLHQLSLFYPIPFGPPPSTFFNIYLESIWHFFHFFEIVCIDHYTFYFQALTQISDNRQNYNLKVYSFWAVRMLLN